MDVAALGLSVDSSQVDKGTLALNKLTGAAGGAQAAAAGMAGGADKMAGAVGKASAAMGLSVDQAGRLRNALGQFATAEERVAAEALQAAGALDEQSAAALRAAQTMRQATAAANDNVSRMGGSMSGLAAQVQDIGVTAAMGMNPMVIALQQGTQIAGQMEMAMQGGGSAAMVFKQALLSLISPISLLSIGLTAVLAAGLQMVDWAWVAQGVLGGVADALEVIAPYAAMAAAGLALVYAPTIIGGIVSLIAMLGRLSVAAITAAASLAMANPGVAFVLGITAAVAAANIFRDELAQIFGVDVVGAAKDAANKVIAFFVGAYNYITSTFADLPAMFSALGKKSINALIDEVSNVPLLTLPGGFEWKVDFSGQKLALNDREKAAMSGLNGSIGEVQKDYLGDFGGAITRGASTAADKLRELAAGLGEVEKKTKKGKSEAEKMADRYDDIVRGARQFISAQELERQSIGMTEQAANRLRYEQDLLNQAVNDNIALTPAQTAELKALAASMAEAEAETTALERAFEFAKDTTKGFFQDLRQGLANGEGFWSSFKNAALNALDAIASKLVESGVDQLFSGGISLGGGGGGIFGAALSGLGSLLGFDEGGWTGGHRGQVRGLVHGEEFVVKAGPAARHRQTLEAMNAGRPAPANNNGGSNNVRVENHYHISGAVSSDDVQRMVRRGAEESVTVVKENLRGWQTDIQLYGKPA